MRVYGDNGTLKKRVVKSVFAQLIGQVLMGFLGVIILKIMTNGLGITAYGTYVTIMAFVSTFSLLTDLGLNTLTSRDVAKYPERAAEIIGHNLGLRIFLSLVMIPVIFGLSFIFYPNAAHSLRIGILLMAMYLFFDVIWAASSSYFTAKVRSDVSAKYAVLQQFMFLGCVIIIAFLGWGLFGYVISYVLTVAVSALLLLHKVRAYISLYPRVNIQAWRKVIKASIALGLISIINTMYLKADSVMISVIKGTAEVGVYGVSYLLVNIFSSLPSYIMVALTPSMTRAKPAELQQIVEKAFHYMIVFACVIVAGGYLARRDIVLVVSSKAFLSAATPFFILTIGMAFSYVSSVLSSASVAINKHHKFVYVSIATLLINVAINFLLIPRYGIMGAAWATVISSVISLIIGYALFNRETGLILRPTTAIKPLIAGVLALTFGVIIYDQLELNSAILNCFLVLVLIAPLYFLVLYRIHGLPEEMQNIISKFLSFFKRHRKQNS